MPELPVESPEFSSSNLRFLSSWKRWCERSKHRRQRKALSALPHHDPPLHTPLHQVTASSLKGQPSSPKKTASVASHRRQTIGTNLLAHNDLKALNRDSLSRVTPINHVQISDRDRHVVAIVVRQHKDTAVTCRTLEGHKEAGHTCLSNQNACTRQVPSAVHSGVVQLCKRIEVNKKERSLTRPLQ